MTERYEGVCVGGPHDRMRLAHWSKFKKFYRPMMAFMPLNIDHAPVEAVEIGEYRLNDFGQWHWWPTENGKAFEKLFGAPRP